MKIYTELINREVEEALMGDFKLIWKVFSGLEGDKEFSLLKAKIKYGLNMAFDIRMVVQDMVEMMPQHNLAIIGKRWKVDIHEFWDEIEEREKEMKSIIRTLYHDDFDNQEEEEIIE